MNPSLISPGANWPCSGRNKSIAATVAKFPRRGILIYKLLEDSMGAHSALGKDFAELIAQYVTELNAQGSAQGGSTVSNLLLSLRADKTGHMEDKFSPIFALVKKLTLSPESILEADVAPIFAAGWDERAFLDSIFLCAIVNCLNRCSIAVDLEQKTPQNFEELCSCGM